MEFFSINGVAVLALLLEGREQGHPCLKQEWGKHVEFGCGHRRPVSRDFLNQAMGDASRVATAMAATIVTIFSLVITGKPLHIQRATRRRMAA